MKTVLIIGSGISGLTAAIETAQAGHRAILVSPYASERAQSVMAAGGINAVIDRAGSEDSIACHINDTLHSGKDIAGEKTVTGLCTDAPAILRWLEQLGVVFTRDESGEIACRAFGGQTYRRTAFSGASTGKHIVTALVQKAREWECKGLIERKLGLVFHSALINDGVCCGALFYEETKNTFVPITADAVILATGGQNALFGKTTGSVLCDGYAAGKLFLQGAALKNPEFIQYHPTTVETPQKRMLITEGARGEGGRLYYENGGERVYFMEEQFGKNGNLMPRDVVSKCEYDAPSQVYLDISFLGEKKIREKLGEVYDLCRTYMDLDVIKESIPVAPSVHFFMGGLAVDANHRTSIGDLYAVGECASMYHGANRLGGNSLLAAVHSARVAVRDILAKPEQNKTVPDFSAYCAEQEAAANACRGDRDSVSYTAVTKELARLMKEKMGVTRSGQKLREGLDAVDALIAKCADAPIGGASVYQAYSLTALLTLARAILTCAEARRETRGAHIREDYPEADESLQKCSVIYFRDGRYQITYESEDELCW